MPKPKTARAAGYVRVSTDEQAKSGLSVAYQKERIKIYCADHGLKRVGWFTDNGVSGGKPLATRRRGKKLVALLRKKREPVCHVIAIKQDRVWRETVDCLSTVRDWWKRGIRFHSIEGGGVVDPTTSNDSLNMGIRAIMDDNFRSLTSERTRAALSVKRARGERLGAHPLFGYRFVYSHTVERQDGPFKIYTVVPHKAEQKTVEVIRWLRSTGLTFRAIVSELASRGVVNRKGGSLSLKAVYNIFKR